MAVDRTSPAGSDLQWRFVWTRSVERFRATSFDARTQEFRHLVRRSREVVLLAAVTGALTGLLVRFFEYVVTEVMLERVLEAPLWFGAIAPGIGLVLAAICLHTFGGRASSATSDEYLRAFHDPEYPIRPRAFVGRIMAAVVTLGFGGPMGLEGPSMYGGSALGAMIQRRLPAAFKGADHRTLLVAGAAAGVSAIFKAPATGAIFALEVPFRDQMARRMLVPALVASASGYLVFAALSSTSPIFVFDDNRRVEFAYKDLLGAVLVGIACAVGARGVRVSHPQGEGLHGTADRRPRPDRRGRVDRVVRHHPPPHRREPHPRELPDDRLARQGQRDLAAGGVFAIRCSPPPPSPAGGGVGGLFIPLVVGGALVGRAVGDIVNPSDPTLYVILGMAAFLGAGYRVPLAAVVFVAETTGQPGFIVPALFAAVAAELVMGEQSITPYQRRSEREE